MHNQPKETGPDSVTCTGNPCGDSDPHSSDFSGSRYCTSCSEREQKGKTGKPEAVWAAGRSAQGVPHGPRVGGLPSPTRCGTAIWQEGGVPGRTEGEVWFTPRS